MTTSETLLIHNVFFALRDRSDASRRKLIDACRKYLPGHRGIVYFACGPLCAELDRDVNVRDWDVGLHIIFADKAAHDEYQESVPHHQFIDENKADWAGVRVFDSLGARSETP